jgi:hypothetical protein
MTADGVALAQTPSLRAERSNPFHHAMKEWIASSQALLAMTAKCIPAARKRPDFA